MRVLVVTPMWPSPEAPHLGSYVVRQVAAFRELGVDVEVAAIDPAPGGWRAPLKWRRLIGVARDRAKAFAPDVVLGHFLFPGGEAARRAAAAVGTPYAVTAHGTDVSNAERSARLRGLTNRVLADCSAVIAVSPALGDRLRAVCRLRCPLETIAMGIDTAAFHPGDRDVAAHALGPEPSRPLIVQVGVKNAERLAAAVAIVRERRGGGSLWLVGPGDLAAIDRHDGVRAIGQVPADRVPMILRAADCATFVSEREGYGLAALEAVAAGIPIVVSRAIPAAADIPGGAGVLADPLDPTAIADAICTALDLPRPLPGAGSIEDHSVRASAERVLATLRQVRRRRPDRAARA